MLFVSLWNRVIASYKVLGLKVKSDTVISPSLKQNEVVPLIDTSILPVDVPVVGNEMVPDVP